MQGNNIELYVMLKRTWIEYVFQQPNMSYM